MYPGHTCPRYWEPSGFLRKTSLIDRRTRGKLIALLCYLTEGLRTARFPWCTDRTGLHTSITGTCGSTKASFTYHVGVIDQDRDGGVDDGNVVLLAGRLQTA